MKRFILSLICLTAVFLLGTNEAKASHTAGGSITYEYIGDSTGIPYNYCITLTLYRREQGISLQPTQTIDINSSCFGPTSVTVTEAQYLAYNPTFTQGGTPRGDTNCIDQTDPGYASGKIEEYRYRGCVTLPGICSDYTFSWDLCCRNGNISNLASFPALYLESKLNNTLGPNTSPSFLNPAAKFFCVGQPFTWSQSASEPDQDSMRFTLAQPWSAANTPINWAAGYSTTSPMTTANGFNFNQNTGLMTFTPTQAEVDVIKIVVEEYRFDTLIQSWLLVGTAIREMQIPILSSCSSVATTGVNITQGETVGGVTSSTKNFNGDSLIQAYGIDSIADYGGSGPMAVDVIGYNCFDSIVNIKVASNLKCSSISDDGSEFRLIGPDSVPRPIVGVEKNCQTTLLTEGFDLYLHKPLDVDGDYLLQVKKGNDGNTIENECGFGVKEFFTLIIRVENCPELEYEVENVTVEIDQQVRVDWWVDPGFFRPESEKLFSQWSIFRATGDGPMNFYAALDDPSDVSARAYVDTGLEMYNLDQTHYRYHVQLVLNNDFRAPTNDVRTILLSDTLQADSAGWDLYWTPYDGWDAPTYEVFKGKIDTTQTTIPWENHDGPDSNFYQSEFIKPNPINESNEGLYVFKVEATDRLDANNTDISESNWIYFDLFYNPEEPPEPPEEARTPNVFTPNGDGRNDIFFVNAEGYTNASIEVYNRWGKLVFRNEQTKAREAGEVLHWDGSDMNSGSKLNDGVYYYVINLQDEQTGESENLTGQVNIFKD